MCHNLHCHYHKYLKLEALQHDIKQLGHDRYETRRKIEDLTVALKDREFKLSFEHDFLSEVRSYKYVHKSSLICKYSMVIDRSMII